MRADMFEVIIERPRGGAGWLKGRRHADDVRRRPDEAPLREPMMRGGRTKHLNENLAPLERFLRSRVGRPWNAVHSEMCEHLRQASAVQKHVLDHVKQLVSLHVVMKDGAPHLFRGWGPHRELVPLGLYDRCRLYVCPKTGILREAPQVRRKRTPAC